MQTLALVEALDTSALTSLAAAVKNLHSLRCLDVSLNGLDDNADAATKQARLDALAALFRALDPRVAGDMPAIAVLDAAGNFLGGRSSATQAMGTLLQGCPSLRRLRISDNLLGKEGAAAIARSLVSAAGLQELDISWNEISDKGASSFASVLQQVPSSLRRLDLSGNAMLAEGRITSKGVALLLDALDGNETLQCLNLIGCAHTAAQLERVVAVRGHVRCCLRPEHSGHRDDEVNGNRHVRNELTSLGIYDPEDGDGRGGMDLWADAEVDASGRLNGFSGADWTPV
jgi:Ran GTPase-activating protein (RanGAP) involved in mRNA processing and transport